MNSEKPLIEMGCLDIWIDEIVSCLKDTETGSLEDTVVFKKLKAGHISENSKRKPDGI